MSIVRIRTDIPINGQVTLDLAPFDRFGGRGGRLSVATTGTLTGADGSLTMSVLVGSDVLINAGVITAEASANRGPDNETPRVTGRGAPSDPITVTVFSTNAAIQAVITEVEIENA